MIKRSERLHKVFLLAETEEHEQCRLMGKIQRRLDENVARLDELKTYRESYGSQLKEVRQFNSVQLKDFQNFLERLDHAIAIQARTILDTRQDLDVQRRRWMAKRRKLESFERVVDRFRSEESAVRERNLQNAADDRAVKGDLFPESAR